MASYGAADMLESIAIILIILWVLEVVWMGPVHLTRPGMLRATSQKSIHR